MPVTSLTSIKKSLENCIGCEIQLSTCGNRRKRTVSHGILDGIYQDVFTILVKDENYTRRFCYTYSEILTNNVSVKLCAKGESK